MDALSINRLQKKLLRHQQHHIDTILDCAPPILLPKFQKKTAIKDSGPL